MKAILGLLILIAMGCNFSSSKSKMDKSALPLIDSFFSIIKTKKPGLALDHLLASNPSINSKDSTTLNLKRSFILINEGSGPYIGYRMLKKRYIEGDISIYSYLAKYENNFYRFIFMFYNNGKSVKLYKFLFDNDLDVELEGALKFYAN